MPRPLLLCCLLLLAVSFPGLAREKLLLYEDGKSAYAIVLPERPTEEEEWVAGELQEAFRRMTGVELPRLPYSQRRSPAFYLGWTPRTEEVLGATAQSMARDQIRLKSTEAGDIFLTGNPVFGIRYALYQFLEDSLGIRWWGWEEESIPHPQRILLPPLDVDHTPPFLERTPTASSLFESSNTFCHKMRVNPMLAKDTSPRAIHTFWERSHTLERLLPDANTLKRYPGLYDPQNPPPTKPEFYAWRDGRRLGADSQPCLTNPDVLLQVTENLKYLLRKEMPNCDVVWVTQNDNTEVCQCPRCLEAVERLGNRSDLNIDFVNRLAEALQEEFPGIAVETFAYQFTLEPPKSIRPSDHVHVRVCLIEASNAHPLTHPFNRPYREALEGWTALSSHVNVWHYTVNFTNLGLCHPAMEAIPQDIRLFQQLHVQKVLTQDSSDVGEFGWFTPYRQSLIAHCLWDPQMDPEAFTQDFFQGYYGPAAPPLLALLKLFQEAAASSSWPMPCYMLDTGRWLTPELLQEGEALVARAMALAQASGNPDYLRRVSVVKTGMAWTRLWRSENSWLGTVTRHSPLVPLPEVETRFQELEQGLQQVRRTPAWKYQYTREGVRLDAHLRQLRQRLAPEAPHRNLPPLLAQTRPQDLVVIPREAYQISPATYVNDAKAPVPHSSVRLPTTGYSWCLRVDLPAIPQAGTWEAFAEVRLPDAVTSPQGIAAMTGFYTYGTNFAEVSRVPLPAAALSREAYRLISLGTIDFHRDYQIYFSGWGNSTVPELLLGRLFLRHLP